MSVLVLVALVAALGVIGPVIAGGYLALRLQARRSARVDAGSTGGGTLGR